MTFEYILSEKTKAMKAGEKTRVKVLNDIIMLVQKEQTKGKAKIEATEEMVAACATKVQKTLEEMVATCPGKTEQKDYTPLLEDYKAQLAIAREYAPQLMSDYNEIKDAVVALLSEYGPVDALSSKSNRGTVMKIVAPAMKGKADMAVVNKVVGEMLV